MNARLTMSGSLLVGVASLAGLAALINLEQPSKWLIGLGLLLVVLAILGFTAPCGG
jgi:hypothetical protein